MLGPAGGHAWRLALGLLGLLAWPGLTGEAGQDCEPGDRGGAEVASLLQTARPKKAASELQASSCGIGERLLKIPELRVPMGSTEEPRWMTVCEAQVTSSDARRNAIVDKPEAKVPLESVAWIILSGFVEKNGSNFQERIVPAAETYLRAASDVYVVVSDTPIAREHLLAAGCAVERSSEGAGVEMAEMRCETRGASLVVLLTPCDDNGHSGNYGKSTCCKYDAALAHLGKGQKLKNKDWVYLADDDMYLQTDRVLEFLGAYDASAPLIVNADGDDQSPKLRKWNAVLDKCNNLIPQGFFYALVSRGLVERLIPSIPQEGLAPLCATTGGSYDTVAGLWVWRHGAKFIPSRHLTFMCVGDQGHCNEKDIPSATLFNHGMNSSSIFAKWQAEVGVAGTRAETLQPQAAGRDYGGAEDPCGPLFEAS